MARILRLQRLLAAIVVAGAMNGAGGAQAAFLGGDNFNDNFKDPARWGADEAAGGNAGALSETNGRLEYTSAPVPNGVNAVGRPWILNKGNYDQSWYVQMDAVIGFASPSTGQFHGGNISLSVRNDAVGNDQATLQFADFNGQRNVRIGVLRDGLTQLFLDTPTDSDQVTLRIAFDAASEELSFLWDSDGATGGLNFALITSISIGSGSADWSMDANSLFNTRIFGAAGEIAITSGQLYADNFLAVTEAVPEPGTLALLAAATGLFALRRRRAALY